MYQVNIGDKILYYPGSVDAQIYDTELNEEVGLAGEFKFRVPPDNPLYSELSRGKLITIYKNKEEYWRGEIKDVKTDFAKIAYVYAVEDLAWLNNEFLDPTKITNQTYAQRFQSVLASYNSTRPAERQFAVGYISHLTSTNLCNWSTEYEWSILESLRECICKATNETGYIRVRRQTSGGIVTRYIDIVKLSDYGVASNQTIEYGYNLLDYVKDLDYGNLVNVLTPYGDELEDQLVYDDYAARLQGTTIANNESINTYGRHAKAVVFDGVTNLASLNALAQSYLTRYCQPQLTMEVQAVDLAEIEEAEEIRIGDSVRIIAKPFAIDQRLYLTQIRRDIQNIDRNSITMSGHVQTGKTLTSQLASTSKTVTELPSTWSVLEAAKRNALEMLLDETQGGHVIFEYDANNTYIEAINICNAATIAASTKRWRWSQNGFGYMKRNNTSQSWEALEVAIDINGNILANAITAGTLNTARLDIGGIVNGINIGNTTINGGKITTDTITALQIAANAITASELAANAVTAAKIYAGAVTAEKISSGAVSADKIAANAVTVAKIYAGAVTADKIATGAVTATKISSSAVTADKIAAEAVTATKLAANAVIASKISSSAVTTDKLDAGAVTAVKIASEAVTADKIKAGEVTSTKIAAGAITATQIASNAVTSSKIYAGAVTTNKLDTGSVTAVKIATGAITADKISAGAITADKIASNAVTADKIKAGEVTSGKIASSAITASKIASGAIDASKISAGAVTADKISSGAVSADKIAADAVTASKIKAGEVTASKIASGAIDASKISAGAVTAAKIAGGAVTADKMNVGTLSAISANMGTITAGEITGGTIKGTTAIIADNGKIAAVNGGYISHRTNSDAGDQYKFDLGARYCNCMYYESGSWRWVNGGATEINWYLRQIINSDRRIKSDLKIIDAKISKSIILDTPVYSFRYKNDPYHLHYGVVAQELEEVLEENGIEDNVEILQKPSSEDDTYGVKYIEFIPHIMNVLKAQQQEIDLLKEEINKLKGAQQWQT
ncbi:MAG: phage tail protein [Lachnospiraceae bacterium]|nr:phage tail protein [Lachnospiraceae bacterium]